MRKKNLTMMMMMTFLYKKEWNKETNISACCEMAVCSINGLWFRSRFYIREFSYVLLENGDLKHAIYTLPFTLSRIDPIENILQLQMNSESFYFDQSLGVAYPCFAVKQHLNNLIQKTETLYALDELTRDILAKIVKKTCFLLYDKLDEDASQRLRMNLCGSTKQLNERCPYRHHFCALSVIDAVYVTLLINKDD